MDERKTIVMCDSSDIATMGFAFMIRPSFREAMCIDGLTWKMTC